MAAEQEEKVFGRVMFGIFVFLVVLALIVEMRFDWDDIKRPFVNLYNKWRGEGQIQSLV